MNSIQFNTNLVVTEWKNEFGIKETCMKDTKKRIVNQCALQIIQQIQGAIACT